ncbi:unnamed protein product [Adineta steineri]|uniref:Uncharacterized protein n=1 Tax=Adineta steineri TaxID=433720 RepID=A0A819NB90_9BILA|nr:unnamed protein product [Adineta steineri]
MPSRKKGSQKKPIIKRLLDGILPNRRSTNETMGNVTDDDTQLDSTDTLGIRSSSALKRHEELPKDRGTSPDPTLTGETSSRQGEEGETPLITANTQFFYSPMYRRSFGLTPPNPRLCNPRLLEDYIDWYINVYMEKDFPWEWMNVGNARQRVEQDEQEAREEAERFASTSTTPTQRN